MTIREIKKEAKILVHENSDRPVFAAWYLYLLPVLISALIVGSLNALFAQQINFINMEFIVPLIMGFYSLWYARYTINIIRGKGIINISRPAKNSFWEYFPYIALLSLLMLLNEILPIVMASYVYILIVILGVIFLPIPFVIVILNRENAGVIGLRLGSKYFWRTIALHIRFIPLYFLIGITFGIVGLFKYTYIQTTFAIYTLDLMNREKI